MEGDVIVRSDLTEFKNYLHDRERSVRTVDKHRRDVAAFMGHVNASQCTTKKMVMGYERHLQETCKITSANPMLAILNCFFHSKGWDDCRVDLFKVQEQLMGSEDRKFTKEKYKRPIKAAWNSENKRLIMTVGIIGNTGIRVSELSLITAESLYAGRIEIYNKGKCRMIFIVKELHRPLLEYCRERDLPSGLVFVTSEEMQMSRNNIWSEVKKLCTKTGTPRQKIFPYNLRHLFAYTYYGIDKDLVHLADTLGYPNVETTRIYAVSTGEKQEAMMKEMKMII